MRHNLLLILLLITAFSAQSEKAIAPIAAQQPQCQPTEAMPAGYRQGNYRAPTPECTPFAVTLDTQTLQRLMEDDQVILVDVLTVLRRADPDFGSIWLPNKDRMSLPGSVWLPNVGYAELSDEMHHFFRSNLQKLTTAKPQKTLVFFCIADCWMSWNAVLRAKEYGYKNIAWYKNGTDGWLESGLPLEKVTPVPLLPESLNARNDSAPP